MSLTKEMAQATFFLVPDLRWGRVAERLTLGTTADDLSPFRDVQYRQHPDTAEDFGDELVVISDPIARFTVFDMGDDDSFAAPQHDGVFEDDAGNLYCIVSVKTIILGAAFQMVVTLQA